VMWNAPTRPTSAAKRSSTGTGGHRDAAGVQRFSLCDEEPA
jgi:hypothetical protein